MLLKKLTSAGAIEVCADIEMSEAALELLNDTIPPGEYFSKLVEAKLTQDAVRFLARGLPRREATWWACLSARHGVTDESEDNIKETITLVEQWVFKPDEGSRYKAYDMAESLSNEDPVYWAAMAVFWSGGSMSPPDAPVVEAAGNLCSMAVTGAVMLAGLTDEGAPSEPVYELFLKQGVAIANGDNAKNIT